MITNSTWRRLADLGYDQEAEFKTRLLQALGITGHPKAEKLYEMAWERGHSSGFGEVIGEALELRDLLTLESKE